MVSRAQLRSLKRRLKVQDGEQCNCIIVSWDDEPERQLKAGDVCPKCGRVVRAVLVIDADEVLSDEPQNTNYGT